MVGWSVSFDPATGSGDLVLWPLPDASGAATLVVSAVEIRSDGEPALVTSRLLTVAITPVNDLPTLAVNRPLALGAGATATYTAADLAIADADLPAKDTLVFTLATPPEHGDLLLADAVLAAGATFTQADVEAGRLAYRNRDGLSDQYAVAIGDGVAAPIGPLLVGVTVAGKGRPWLDLGTVDARWREGDEAFLPCAAARLEDGDSPLLDGGRLTVTWGGGQAAGDRLDLLHQGGGAGQLAVEGAALAYGGRPIGSWSGGGAGEALTVLLAGPDATPAAAQAVLRALRFRHQGDDPGLRTTLLEVVADDGDAGASLPARLWITTEPVNDPPRPQAAIIGTMAGVARTAILAASDPDSSALAWTLTGADPALGATLADAASGRVRLAPAAGWSGTGLLTWRVSDGTVAVAATSAVVVTGPDQPRPLPAAEAPALAVAGELVEVVVPWDCADLPAAGPLDFAAAEGAPAGLTVTALDARRMRVAWAVPATQPAGVVRFTVIATDPVGGACGCWPALIAVRARPGGAN
ncbi:MAG: Ig-like domain-containing protein [Planctomycetes bacterium]|nr:Ig-like domain-containing protein [Planctomycetota bacterium]